MAPRDPNDRRHVPMKARLDQWALVRHSKLALEAVELGVSWSLKCLIISDARLPGEISLDALKRAKASAAATAARIQGQLPLHHKGRPVGIMPPQMAARALAMYDQLAVLEVETAEEIMAGRHGSTS